MAERGRDDAPGVPSVTAGTGADAPGSPLLRRVATRLVVLADQALALEARRLAHHGEGVGPVETVEAALAVPLDKLLEEALILFGLAAHQRELATLGELHHAIDQEVRRSRERMWRSGTTRDELLEACDVANHKLRRGLRVLLAALGREEAAERLWRWEVDSAIRVRALYARFRSSLARPKEGGGAALAAALEQALGALEALVGDDAFVEARTFDRRTLLALRARIEGWRARGPAHTAEGLLLLDDLHGAADLLLAINLREELLEHDLAVLVRLEQLAALGATDSEEIALHLATLRGRDGAIDALRVRLAEQGWDARARDDLAAASLRLAADLAAAVAARG